MAQLRPKIKMCLAKALYDNVAESVDEIGFRRGDVLMVIEQNTSGLDGWWLCSFKGKQGIAPGNRLQIISAISATPHAPAQQPVPQTSQPPEPDPNETNWKRRSWHLNPDKVVTPHKMGNVYIYDQPNRDYQDYDVPPSRYFPTYDGFTGDHGAHPVMQQQKDVYDSPQSCLHDHMSNRSSSVSVYSTGSGLTVSSSMSNHSLPAGSEAPSSCGSTRSSTDYTLHDIYDIPPQPKPLGREGLMSPGSNEMELYDVPPSSRNRAITDIYDTPPSKRNIMQEIYDHPPCKQFPKDIYDTPPSKTTPVPQLKSLMRERFDSPCRDGRASSGDSGIVTSNSKLDSLYDIPQATLEQMIDEIYDIPPSNSKVGDQGRVKGLQAHGCLDPTSVYDIPPQVTRDSAISMQSEAAEDTCNHRLSTCSSGSEGPLVIYDELPLDLDSAMELLVKLQQEVQSSTSKLLSFVSSSWRLRENIEPVVYHVKTACHTFRNALKEFFDFGCGTLANSAKAEDKKLIKKLSKHLEPIQIAHETVTTCVRGLDNMGWQMQQLVDHRDIADDDLNVVVFQAKEVPAAVRTLASLIQGNSTLLFKRSVTEADPMYTQVKNPGPPVKPKPVTVERKTSIQDRPLPAPPPGPGDYPNTKNPVYEVPKDKEEQKIPVIEDYDYVSLDKKMDPKLTEKNGGQQQDMANLTARFKERLEQVQHKVSPTEKKKINAVTLHENDRQMLSFYSHQVEIHSATIVTAMDYFFNCIESSQPPKVFIAQCKLVILAAHKLVYMGDTLHRNILNEEVRNKIMTCANDLCDTLKMTVTATKNAALQFPCVTYMQDMVDRVVDVSHAANELKLVIAQAASL